MREIKILTVIFCIISTISYSQNNDKMKLPEINKDFEKFNVNVFSKDTSGIERVKSKVSMTTDTVFVNVTASRYEERDRKNKLLSYYFRSEEDETAKISGYDYSVNPLIATYKEFFQNGNIHLKGLYCWFGFKIGIWYTFDESGNLINQENTDLGYEFTYEDVFNYCRQNNISLDKEDKFRTHITKGKSRQGMLSWFISFTVFKKQKIMIYELNGENGELVSIQEQPLNTRDIRE